MRLTRRETLLLPLLAAGCQGGRGNEPVVRVAPSRLVLEGRSLVYGPLHGLGPDGPRLSFGLAAGGLIADGVPGTRGTTERVVGRRSDFEPAVFERFPELRVEPVRPVVAAGRRGRLRIAFGSCARVTYDPQQTIFDHLGATEPDALLLLGDTVYNDSGVGSLSRKYDLQLGVPAFRRVLARTHVLATWDDHDYWANGCTADDVSEADRAHSRALFTSIFPNPTYGEGGEGIYTHASLGDVDVFMLDGRWFRRPSRRSFLGARQTGWLRWALTQSRATFKVVACGSPWFGNPRDDTWTGYAQERDALLAEIFAARVSGVVLLAGDIHRALARRIVPDLPHAYPLYELVVSNFAVPPRETRLDIPPEQLIDVGGSGIFGLLDFDTDRPEPTLHFSVRTRAGRKRFIDGEETLEIRASELRAPFVG